MVHESRPRPRETHRLSEAFVASDNDGSGARPIFAAVGWPWRSTPTSLEALAIRLTAPASEFTQLRTALERQLALTRDSAAAADAESALEAFLDADAISAELLE